MRAKQFFQQVSRAERELKLIRAQIAHYEDIGFSLSGGNSDATGGGKGSRSSSRVEAAAIGIFDATRALHDQEREYMALIARARQVIGGIHQEKYRDILTYRYLCGWSFRSISDELAYNDPNSVYRSHGWALSEAQKILNKLEDADGQNRNA